MCTSLLPHKTGGRIQHNKDVYDLQQFNDGNRLVFFFISYGEQYTSMIISYEFVDTMMGRVLYNLGFGIFDAVNNCIVDQVTTDNGDVYKVFNTVLSTIPLFFDRFMDCILMVKGSDGIAGFADRCKLTCRKRCEQYCRNFNRRIKIYCGYLNKNFKELVVEYQFFGEFRDQYGRLILEEYQPYKEYETVFVLRKKL